MCKACTDPDCTIGVDLLTDTSQPIQVMQGSYKLSFASNTLSGIFLNEHIAFLPPPSHWEPAMTASNSTTIYSADVLKAKIKAELLASGEVVLPPAEQE